MHLASFQVQIGAVSGLDLTTRQEDFHARLSVALQGGSPTKHSSRGVPITHYEAVHEPRALPLRILAHLKALRDGESGPPKITIIDLCSTPFFLLRDPLLLDLAAGVAEASSSELCSEYVLLLPKMPGERGAFLSSLKHIRELAENAKPVVHVISNDGSLLSYRPDEDDDPRSSLGVAYTAWWDDAYGDTQTRIERKSVRRLGHFAGTRPRERTVRCRHYSYFVHDCGTEMLRKFQAWWDTLGVPVNAILHDLKSNELMRDVVLAHAVRIDVRAERIIDVLSDDTLASDMRRLTPAVIVLDAIETGATFRYYADNLRALDIAILDDVFVTVSKHGDQLSDPMVRIGSLITRPREPAATACVQCSLGLPFTKDGGEQLRRIRSYDLLYMIDSVKWTQEPHLEVPYSIGRKYESLPNFAAMLDLFGDWIGYKLYQSIVEHGVPEAWFLIHPEEGDSSSLCRRIYDAAEDEVSIVSVPRRRIDAAQAAGDAWAEVLGLSADEPWAGKLRGLRGAAGVVVDIFNGSGSTSRSLIELVRQSGNQPVAYACVIDFNPDVGDVGIAGVESLSLYEWPVPRILNKEGLDATT